ncbi:MAG: ankyrin repeat domain-containing protein [Bacteroidota bacterium]|nr:ankyrin repeat domain-containing protein [Bacteroidota bacterium]MDP4218622.1 ankyrin repeat domain-containing protein [Bacteroidota bacterium]MDP4245342.1 ankyrin repeat domain-containing protein [Bacteroidota bacterium]MDP4252619.1 ankyrin repeat domain-containing protein [Bacteroidota bacterium]MDP4258484.1 ankyrin repeat domain-containing protein [Bacteroidota bacterium]
MSTVKRRFPAKPHLDVPKQQARDLLRQCKAGLTDAFDRVRRHHPRFKSADNEAISSRLKLSDAQLVLAHEYGFASWTELKERIAGNTVALLIEKAIRSNDATSVTELLTSHPNLLHVPVRSGNWGPPMSYAANLGLLDMVKVIAGLGARDFQHAFVRALLHGDIETAKWLHEHGAVFTPGIIMGSCETLNERGFGFLDDSGAPLTDEKGNRQAPLTMILETYSRHPAGKHAILERFRARGYDWEDGPVMAFHCGDLDRLKIHFQRDPQLIHRRFSYREIYPPELGCADDGRSGLHGTPIDGTTLLHLSIDFDEREIFDWLLEQGADVNAPATVDNEGFGGHSPLFNAIVSCAYSNGRQRDGYMAFRLLDLGADVHVRVNMRKYLDWCETPGWHIAKNVTPLEWATGFPERTWVNKEVVDQLTMGPTN